MWPFSRNDAAEIRSAQPYWLYRNGIADAGSSLANSIDCDIAIVGAGITGALIADALVENSRRVVIVDQRDQALGSTSASTALLQYEIDQHLIDLEQALGSQQARLAYTAGVESISLIEKLATECTDDVNFARRLSLYLASNEGDLEALRKECAARKGAGIEVEWLDGTQLIDRFGCHRPGGILSSAAAQLDPIRLTRSLFERSVQRGAQLYARTSIEEIEDHGDRITLRTATGQLITASHAIVCGGYESLKFLPVHVAELHSTYALATEPVQRSEHAVKSALIWESARPYLYLRGTPDDRIIVGGADVPFKNSAVRDSLLPQKVKKIQELYRTLFATELPPVAYAWAGTFGETADGLPYIGHAPGTPSRLLFALCFGGNGITYSAHAGAMLRATIENAFHPLHEIFGFSRLARCANRAGAYALV
jgi:glycine/D-amino acid oxidase-like deaminating enzyme